MRLILLDRPTEKRLHFHPLALSRPIWELRCGMTTLAEKLVTLLRPQEVACFVPPYMAGAYAATTAWPVNELARLAGDDLLVVNPRAKASGLADVTWPGPSMAWYDAGGELLCARIARSDLPQLRVESIEGVHRVDRRGSPGRRGTTACLELHLGTWCWRARRS